LRIRQEEWRRGEGMINKTPLTIILLSGLVLFFCYFCQHRNRNPSHINLFFEHIGEVVPCGCIEAGNAGGISRRSHYINMVREKARKFSFLMGETPLVIASLAMKGSNRKPEKGRICP